MMVAAFMIPPVSVPLGMALLYGRDEDWKPFFGAGFVAGCLGALIVSVILVVIFLLFVAIRRQRL